MRKSDANIVWVDLRVFWCDMPYRKVNTATGGVLQSSSAYAPLQFWVDAVELTFNGANNNDLFGIYDQMFNCYQDDKAVMDAVEKASIAINDLDYFRK